MNFDYSDEQRMVKDTLDRFIRDRYPIEVRHRSSSTETCGYSAAIWSEFAELGVIGMLFPEGVGGYGGAGEDYVVVFEALGRGLVVEPFLAGAVLGAVPILLAGSEVQKENLKSVIDGKLMLALAYGETASRYSLSHIETGAIKNDAGWRLDGSKTVVINAPSADKLVVSARVSGKLDSEDGVGLFLVDAKHSSVTQRAYRTGDGFVAAEVKFNASPAEAIGTPGMGYAVLEETAARGILAVCAEAVGIMEDCHAETLEYLKNRKQFGKPIGANQVLQHRMVDLLIEIEQARSAVLKAANGMSKSRLERESCISAAKFLIGRVGHRVAQETIQMHGAIGMAWESRVAHGAKRLTLIDHILGDMDHHIKRFSCLNH